MYDNCEPIAGQHFQVHTATTSRIRSAALIPLYSGRYRVNAPSGGLSPAHSDDHSHDDGNGNGVFDPHHGTGTARSSDSHSTTDGSLSTDDDDGGVLSRPVRERATSPAAVTSERVRLAAAAAVAATPTTALPTVIPSSRLSGPRKLTAVSERESEGSADEHGDVGGADVMHDFLESSEGESDASWKSTGPGPDGTPKSEYGRPLSEDTGRE